jgi:membrane protein
MKQKLKTLFELLKQTFKDWQADHAPRLAAALAYYTAFSLAPLLVIAIAIAGLLLGQDQVRTQVLGLVQSSVSADAATLLGSLLDSAAKPREGLIATVIGLVTLVFGAIGAFGQLQNSLDAIWDVEDRVKPGGIIGMIRTNLLNFGMVIFLGFLLLVSLVLSTILTGVGQWMGTYLGTGIILQIINIVIGFAVITLLFALIYKVLPHTEVAWRDVWVGAAFTALLFSVGRYVLSLYLATSGTASSYGAAGSFVVILLWIYYSAQILLFGAEFTQVFSARFGTRAARAGQSGQPATVNALKTPVAVPLLPALASPPPKRRDKPANRLVTGVLLILGMIGMAFVASRRPEAAGPALPPPSETI